jgi:long-chain acyl-CoA synthetase
METCIEMKLVDVPDLGYFTSNVPPQGEILVRGPTITSGYLNRPEETAALVDSEGWMKTGDIGQFDRYGNLKIIDRVKNLVKTLNGEYIAIEKVPPFARHGLIPVGGGLQYLQFGHVDLCLRGSESV